MQNLIGVSLRNKRKKGTGRYVVDGVRYYFYVKQTTIQHHAAQR